MKNATPAPVHVHIDRIVLDGFGFGPHDRATLEAALQQRLGELLAERAPAADRAGARPTLIAPAIGVRNAGDASGLGRSVAQSLHRGLLR